MLKKIEQKGSTFLWILLITSLVLCITVEGLSPALKKSTLSENIETQSENGIGGIGAEKIFDLGDIDPFLGGVPEPEEFSRPHMLTFSSYTIQKGDMIGPIALKAGLSEDALISVNNIKNTRLMQIGQVIRIPNQDGIYYSVKSGDTLSSIAEEYNTTVSSITTANELFSDTIKPEASLFIPGGKLDWINRQEINGDLFIWPCAGYISSSYGYRIAPFGGTRSFHSGLDIASPMGSTVRAAMAGRAET